MDILSKKRIKPDINYTVKYLSLFNDNEKNCQYYEFVSRFEGKVEHLYIIFYGVDCSMTAVFFNLDSLTRRLHGLALYEDWLYKRRKGDYKYITRDAHKIVDWIIKKAETEMVGSYCWKNTKEAIGRFRERDAIPRKYEGFSNIFG